MEHLKKVSNSEGERDQDLAKRQCVDDEPIDLDNRISDEPEQIRKLFIGGLDYKTSEETLKKHFEKFGDVVDCVVVREPQSKRSRGFGFVIYANLSMVDKAQLARPHEIDGRLVQSKRAVSREDSGKPESQATVKKVYLGGLSDDIEEPELREYFKEFGNIVNINIVAHKDTGKRRGFAFVEYDDHDPVDKIVLKKFHLIKDKRVEAKKAIPKVEMDARKRADPRSNMAAGAMISLACDPYGMHRGYQTAPIDGYSPHYHQTSPHHGAKWMMPGTSNQTSPYALRISHGGPYSRGGYPNQAAAAAAAAAAVVGGWLPPDYQSYPVSLQTGGIVGPIRPSFQHRSFRPYSYGPSNGNGAPTSRRGYNP